MLNKSAKQSRRKKAFALILAAIMTCGFSVAGTYAWLSTQTDILKNTFAPSSLFNNCSTDFILYESNAVYNEALGTYGLGQESTKTGNDYVIFPGVDIPKDPTVSFQNLKEDAYLYIVVTDNLPVGLSYSIDDSNWETLTGYQDVWVYKGNYASNNYITASNIQRTINILKDKKMAVSNTYVPTTADDIQLNINAYMVQAIYNGDSALEAWNNTCSGIGTKE